MFDTIGRGWEITKLSFGVIKQDKEMLLFPILGGIFSLLYSLLVLWPTVISYAMDPGQQSLVWGTVQNIAAFATYLGLSFIATFFNTCTVYTAKVRFAGGDATFSESLKFALSRVHLIFGWSLVAATVGMIFRILDQMAERMGGIGGLIFEIINGLFGMMWNVLTLFVVPVMVYEGLGPMDAIKRSSQVLKRTWGESLVRHFGLGIIQFIVCIPGGLLVMVGLGGAFPLAILGFVWIIGVVLTFTVANTVFNAALYEYANTGRVPSGFTSDAVRGAFVQKTRQSSRF